MDEYWIDQFRDISLYPPVIAVFNQIDKLNRTQIDSLKQKFSAPTKEHFVLETILYCSAYSLLGISECKQSIINVLRGVRSQPRWILIDPYSWKLNELFECALHRIFRLLDVDGDNVLNLTELRYFNTDILGMPPVSLSIMSHALSTTQTEEEFTADAYNFLLRRLNEENDGYVTPQGLTFDGFGHLMKRFAIAKKWDRCWDVLRFFHYQNDLSLHPRVFPKLPHKEKDQTLELSKYVFVLLERLFRKFADDTVIDNDTKSFSSSMISGSVNKQIFVNDADGSDGEDDDEDEGMVLSMDGVRRILAVLPTNKPSLHCTLLDRHVIDHFETAGRKLNKLTKNGWLSFWAMFAVENAAYCFAQLTYLDLSSDTDRNSWFKLTERKLFDHQRERISRSVIRVLLFGGPQCGKTVFCDRLLCRIPIAHKSKKRSSKHRPTQHFRAVSNRIGASNEYNFLAMTEVPAITQYIEQAMDNFLGAYDMILLMFDLSESRSFYELNKIFDRMPKNHSLPIQVLASKADLKHVEQFNLDLATNNKYGDISAHLEQIGLYQYAPTWLSQNNDSCDFPQLFDDLFFIATNPHFRRLKNVQIDNSENDAMIDWKTIIKRTVTITAATTMAVYGCYRFYKWFYSKAQPTNSSVATTRTRYRR